MNSKNNQLPAAVLVENTASASQSSWVRIPFMPELSFSGFIATMAFHLSEEN